MAYELQSTVAMSMSKVILIRNAQYVEAVRLLEDCGLEARDEGIFLLFDLLQLTMVPHWLRLLANLALSLYSEDCEASEVILISHLKGHVTDTRVDILDEGSGTLQHDYLRDVFSVVGPSAARHC